MYYMSKQRYLYYFILISLLSSHEVFAQEIKSVNSNTSSDNLNTQQNINPIKNDVGQSHAQDNVAASSSSRCFLRPVIMQL